MTQGTGPGALDEGRDRRRTALLAAPWAVAGVLGLLGVLAARDAPVAPTPQPTSQVADSDPSQSAGPNADEAVPLPAASAATDDVATALPAETELAVLATARTALGAAGLVTSAAGADRWALEVRIAAVDVVTAEHAVATVHGLVIEHRDGGWHGPRPEAVAVLVRTTPAPAVVGGAWPLPTPTLPTTAPELRRLEDHDPDVVAPLQDAGWAVEEVVSVEASDGALLRISVHGTPPGAPDAADHVLWLLDAPGGPRLLPLAAPTTTEDLP